MHSTSPRTVQSPIGVAPRSVAWLMHLWLLLLAAAGSELAAQDYLVQQTLQASTLGEGQPGLRHGARVALDGDLAVVADAPEFRASTTLRTWVRVGRIWQPEPDLTFTREGRQLVDIALSGNLLLVSTLGASGGSGNVAIFELTPEGWHSPLSFTDADDVDGSRVALDAETGIIVYGVPGDGVSDAGMAIVRRRNNSGGWSRQFLDPSPVQAGARFGASVAIVAGAVVVGAPREDIDVAGQLRTDAGAAYVFELTQDTWNQVNRFTSATPQSTAHFGHAVAISGLDTAVPDRILVGAPREDNSAGAVYGYTRGNSAWSQSLRLNDAGGEPFQRFGSALAMDGQFAAIGADAYRLGDDLIQAGAVYGAAFTSNFASATLVRRNDPQPAMQDRVGEVVAIDRDGPTVLIGVPRAEMYSLNDDQGIVLLSDGDGPAPPFPPLQRVFDLGQGLYSAAFGSSLATQGDVLVVGAPFESVGSQPYVGAAYLFRRQGDGHFAEEMRLQSPAGLGGDLFGSAVEVHGDLALIGAPGVAGGGIDDRGIVYAYRHAFGTWTLEAVLNSRCASTSPQRGSFGRRIAFDGTRALIGGICPVSEGIGLDLGTALYTRAPDGSWTSEVITDAPRMGAGAWDGELAIIGMPATAGPAHEMGVGSVYAYLRDTNGNWNITAGSSGSGSVQGYGFDLAADQGVLAIASHAPNYPVVVRRRSGDGFLPETALIAPDLDATAIVNSVDVRGDLIAFGAHRHTITEPEQGAVYLYQRSAGTWSQRQKLTAPQAQAGVWFGSEVAIGGDGTLFVSAPYETRDFEYEGAVHVLAPPAPELFADGFE